jgi:2-polyprenyl-3-methyl-5-hydroxy-6-metoxy-1,4-benzoquinol methylase
LGKPDPAELAAVEILDVATPERAPDQLWGASVDSPAPGNHPGLHIAAWAIGRSAPAAAVEVVSEGKVLAVAPLRVPRPDLTGAFWQAPEAAMSGMAVDLDASELPDEFEVLLRVVLQNGERVGIGSIRGRRADPSGTSAESPAAPTLEPDVRGLLQSLVPSGFDESGSHEAILDRIALRGQKVLDVGAGLGNASRAARARGAAIVDGFESDAELVRLARLMNACHHATRVSFYHRDIAQPGSYDERYGVVLALSAFDQVSGVLGSIADITEGTLVTIVSDVERDLTSIGAGFAHQEVLNAAQGLVVAAHTGEALAAALRPEHPIEQAAR